MLHFHTLSSPTEALAYFTAGNDYYLAESEMQPFWLGKGAELLRLNGEVQSEQFKHLLLNQHPATGEKLTNAKRDDRDFARDMTVSVPKSVSIIRQLGGDDRIADVERKALKSLFALIERDAQTRVRKAGADFNRTTGNLVASVFQHQTSRYPDPQDHFHVVISNLTYDAQEGEWKAVQFRNLLRDSGYYNAVFRSELAAGLRELGYDLRRTKDAFEIVGVPERVISEFSKRTQEVEQKAVELGIVNPEAKSKLGATTRKAKERGVTFESLLSRWEKRLRDGEREAIDSTVNEANMPLLTQDVTKESVTYALEHLLERKSVVRERDVIREALYHAVGQASLSDVQAELLSRKDVIRRNVAGDVKISTNTVLQEERLIFDFAAKGKGACRPLKLTKVKDSALLAGLTESQQAAVLHVWNSTDRVMLISGAAGTGKTTLTRTALKGINVPWVILAPSAKASRGVLRDDGFQDANTLAKFLGNTQLQEQSRNGLIWLDEAGMASGKDVAKLVKLADSLNARIVMSGDVHQHRAVQRGDPLELFVRAGLPVARVTEIKRQTGDYLRVAEMMRDGRMLDAMEKLDTMGWIKDGGVVDDYIETMKSGKTAALIVPTHAESDRVTEQLRERMKAEKLLHDEREVRRLRPLHLTEAELGEMKKQGAPSGVILTRAGAFEESKQKIAIGDILRVVAPIKDMDGKEIDTGAALKVTGWGSKGEILVKSASGKQRALANDVGRIVAGYATTSQGAQGVTVDHLMLWMTEATLPAVRRDTAYTAGTRGREKLTIYTDDREALLEAVQRENERMLATDLVRIKPRRNPIAKAVERLREMANYAIDKARMKRSNQRGRHE